MEQNLLINKDVAVKLCNSIELVYNSASELKSIKEEDYESISEHLDAIANYFKIKDQLGVLLLSYFKRLYLIREIINKSSIHLENNYHNHHQKVLK